MSVRAVGAAVQGHFVVAGPGAGLVAGACDSPRRVFAASGVGCIGASSAVTAARGRECLDAATSGEIMSLDPVSKMFSWWNEAYKTPGAYTEEAFGIYFTDDAELIIDGRLVTRGVGGWAKHFQAI